MLNTCCGKWLSRESVPTRRAAASAIHLAPPAASLPQETRSVLNTLPKFYERITCC